MIEEITNFDAACTDPEEKKIPDYKKTSMKNAVNVMDKFLVGLSKENAARRMRENGMFKFHFPLTFLQLILYSLTFF